jgi:hypothetical protein
MNRRLGILVVIFVGVMIYLLSVGSTGFPSVDDPSGSNPSGLPTVRSTQSSTSARRKVDPASTSAGAEVAEPSKGDRPVSIVGVLHDQNGRGVADVRILLETKRPDGMDPSASTIATAADGSFAIPVRAAVGQRLILRGAQSPPFVVQKSFAATGNDQRVDLVCSTEFCVLEGRLEFEDGSPVREGFVHGSSADVVQTNALGEFQVLVPVFHGEAALTYGTSQPPWHRTNVLHVGGEQARGLRLICRRAEHPIRLRVTDTAGAPVVATIAVDETATELRTDSNGECEVAVDAQGWPAFRVRADGFLEITVRLSLGDRSSLAKLIVLPRAAQTRVRVIDDAGAPCVGAVVSDHASDVNESAMTDSEGQVRLRVAASGRPHVFQAVAADGRMGTRLLPPMWVAGDITIVVQTPRFLHGRVVDSDGAAVAGADVHGVFLESHVPRTDMPRSDVNGRFRLPYFGTGEVEVSARKTGYGRAVLWTDLDASDVLLSLPPLAFVSCRLLGIEAWELQFFVRVSVASEQGDREITVLGPRRFHGVDRFAVPLEDVAIGGECIVRVSDTFGRREVTLRTRAEAEPGRYRDLDLR